MNIRAIQELAEKRAKLHLQLPERKKFGNIEVSVIFHYGSEEPKIHLNDPNTLGSVDMNIKDAVDIAKYILKDSES